MFFTLFGIFSLYFQRFVRIVRSDSRTPAVIDVHEHWRRCLLAVYRSLCQRTIIITINNNYPWRDSIVRTAHRPSGADCHQNGAAAWVFLRANTITIIMLRIERYRGNTTSMRVPRRHYRETGRRARVWLQAVELNTERGFFPAIVPRAHWPVSIAAVRPSPFRLDTF